MNEGLIQENIENINRTIKDMEKVIAKHERIFDAVFPPVREVVTFRGKDEDVVMTSSMVEKILGDNARLRRENIEIREKLNRAEYDLGVADTTAKQFRAESQQHFATEARFGKLLDRIAALRGPDVYVDANGQRWEQPVREKVPVLIEKLLQSCYHPDVVKTLRSQLQSAYNTIASVVRLPMEYKQKMEFLEKEISTAASCTCGLKTPNAQYHNEWCIYKMKTSACDDADKSWGNK